MHSFLDRMTSDLTSEHKLSHLPPVVVNSCILFASDPPMSCHLAAVEGFACPNEPGSSVARGFKPLVGSPKANRS